MPQTETRAEPSRTSFSFPSDVPGVLTVLRMEGNTDPVCYLNENFTIKLLQQSQSDVHFRGKTLSGDRGIVGLLDPGEMLRTSNVRAPEIIHGVMIRPDFLAVTRPLSRWLSRTALPSHISQALPMCALDLKVRKRRRSSSTN